MANYETLKADVSAVIKANGNNEITGLILQTALLAIISGLGENSTFKGIALPATNPGAIDGRVFFIANEPGTYTSFGLTVEQGEIAIFDYNATWTKKSLPVRPVKGDFSFLTDKSTPAKCFSVDNTGFGSVTIPIATLYYIYRNEIHAVTNPGVTLAATSGNIHLILLNNATFALSMVDYVNETWKLNKDLYIVGYYYSSIGYLDINGDVYGINEAMTERDTIKFAANMRIVVDSVGVNKFLPETPNGGSAITSGGTYKVTAAGTGYSGVFLPKLKLIDLETYFIDVEVKKESGDNAVWYIGDPSAADRRVGFTPTTTWQKVRGMIVGGGNTVTYGLFLSGGIGAVNEIVSFRNLEIRQMTYIEKNHDDRIIALEDDSIVITDLQAHVNSNKNCFIPPGTYELTTTLTIPSGTRIWGVPGESIIKAGAALTTVIIIGGKTDIILDGIKILGVSANVPLGGAHNAPAAGVVDTFANAIAETNKGTRRGIYLNASERINIRNCEISNFDAYGILDELCGKTYEYGIKLTDNYIHDCYCGMKTQSEAEYSTWTSNSFTKNQIGLYISTGNNIFINNHVDKNRVGLVMSDGLNNSHGSFTGCTINHNSLYGVALNGLGFGEIFSGCQFWYADIYVKNSKGVCFTGCELGATTVYADGNFVGGGMWMICNSVFAGGSVVQNYLGNVSNVKLKNNWFMDGSSSTGLNN